MNPRRRTTPRAAIVAVGSELLRDRMDTNGAALARRLRHLGIEPRRRLQIPDQRENLADALRGLLRAYPLVLCCGGLGPTQDDVTREAAAAALRRPLRLHRRALAQTTTWFRRQRRAMSAVNRVQALLPRGARWLPNHWGTAQGFAVSTGGRWLAALPGPPRECLPMFDRVLAPLLARALAQDAAVERTDTVRTVGLSESGLQERLGPWFASPEEAELGFLLDEPGEILVTLTVRGLAARAAAVRLARGRRRVLAVVGEDVADARGRSLPEAVGRLLRKNGQTVAVAESCTGGLISQRLTSVPGSSRYFLEGVVAYHNEAKRRLGVPATVLAAHGAVSAETAAALACAVKRRTRADWGLAVTGIAGPGGGTRAKPAGLVFLGLAGPDRFVETLRLQLNGEREWIQRRSATLALDWLRRVGQRRWRGGRK